MAGISATVLRLSIAFLAAGLVGAVVGCTDSVAPIEETTPPSVTSPSAEPGSSESPTSDVSKEEAGRIATEKYGGTISSIEDDSYNGEPAWEVEIGDSTEGRIEVKVSKETGETLGTEHD